MECKAVPAEAGWATARGLPPGGSLQDKLFLLLVEGTGMSQCDPVHAECHMACISRGKPRLCLKRLEPPPGEQQDLYDRHLQTDSTCRLQAGGV